MKLVFYKMISQAVFFIHFLCLSKENEPKERTLLGGIFKLRLKPAGKLCVTSFLNFRALLSLFYLKDLNNKNLKLHYYEYS